MRNSPGATRKAFRTYADRIAAMPPAGAPWSQQVVASEFAGGGQELGRGIVAEHAGDAGRMSAATALGRHPVGVQPLGDARTLNPFGTTTRCGGVAGRVVGRATYNGIMDAFVWS